MLNDVNFSTKNVKKRSRSLSKPASLIKTRSIASLRHKLFSVIHSFDCFISSFRRRGIIHFFALAFNGG